MKSRTAERRTGGSEGAQPSPRERRVPGEAAASFRGAVLLVLLAAALSSGACSGAAPTAEHTTLDSLEALRTAFNADADKVRAVFLASPT